MTDDVILFDKNVARQYGVKEAIFIGKIWTWIKHNAQNNQNFYDGKYWTYNSSIAFMEWFPFWSQRQIERLTAELVANNILLKGNYNKTPFDRTSWFTLSDEALAFMFKLGYSLQPKAEEESKDSPFSEIGKSDLPKIENGFGKNGKSKSRNGGTNTNINTNNITNKSKKEKDFSFSFVTNQNIADAFSIWCKYSIEQFKTKETRLQIQYKMLEDYSQGDAAAAYAIIQRAIDGGFDRFVPLAENITTQQQTKWE